MAFIARQFVYQRVQKNTGRGDWVWLFSGICLSGWNKFVKTSFLGLAYCSSSLIGTTVLISLSLETVPIFASCLFTLRPRYNVLKAKFLDLAAYFFKLCSRSSIWVWRRKQWPLCWRSRYPAWPWLCGPDRCLTICAAGLL